MVHFALTIFISAFLLFQVQPLIAKSILPWFGGGSSVWTTCMLFFQIVLVGGYAYAHLLTVKLSPRRQGLVHMVLLLLSLALLPIVPSPRFKPDSSDAPVMAILWLLLATVGGPYFMLSSTGPLMQRWFSRLFVGRSPYRLYALSNVGSLLALLSYPFVIEPTMRLRWQTGIWSIMYALFAVLAVWCSLRMLKLNDKPAESVRNDGEPELDSDDVVVRPSVSRMLLWLGLSALGSAMLLATTNQMCIDVAVFPFLWVLPLSLYLLSFIICFDSPRWYDRRVFGMLLIPAVVAACWQLNQKLDTSIPVIIGIYSSVMFVCCMTCHGELVSARPHPRYLTLFYLLVSVGGAMGGAFVAIVSPLIFKGFWEYHVALAGACGVTLMAWAIHRVWQGSCAVTFWIGALVSVMQIWLVIELVVRQAHPALTQIELEILLGVSVALHAIGWVLTARLQSKGAGLVWGGVAVGQLAWVVGWTQTQFTGMLESRQFVWLSLACGAVVSVGILAAWAIDRRMSETTRRWLLIVGLQCIVAIGLWLLWKEKIVAPKTLTQCMIGLVGVYLMGLCWSYFKSASFARGGGWFWGPAVLGWVLLLMILTKYMQQDRDSFVHVSRNFYGVLKVTSESDHNGDYYSLMNGQIEHGTQYLDDYWKRQPTTYYGQSSAVDLAMKYHPRRLSADPEKRSLKVGVVGLGAGTIAAYGRSADIFRFYEINRSVIEIASQVFTYLKDSAAKIELVLGDARMALEREWFAGGSQRFDVLAIDAFSSDAIPLHLLTRECSELYRQHLAPDGLLLIHISNRYLDLNPVTLALAEHLDWKAVRIESDDNLELGIHAATWVIITANEEFLAQSEIQQAHSPWDDNQTKLLWTDDFASLWQVISY